ncbi:hypothetical protein D3C77_670090 [compost metagenome]
MRPSDVFQNSLCGFVEGFLECLDGVSGGGARLGLLILEGLDMFLEFRVGADEDFEF